MGEERNGMEEFLQRGSMAAQFAIYILSFLFGTGGSFFTMDSL